METQEKRRERGAQVLLVTASLAVVVYGLWALKPIALPLLMAIFLAILSAPLLTWLTRHRIPRPIAVVVTVLANVTVMAVFLLLIGSSIYSFARTLPRYQQRIEERIEAKETMIRERLEALGFDMSELDWLTAPDSEGLGADEETSGAVEPDPSPLEPNLPESSEPSPLGSFVEWGFIFDLVGSTLGGIVSVFSMILLVFLLMIFILFEASILPKKLHLVFGLSDGALDHFTGEIQRYLFIKTVVSLATGLLVGLGVWALGVGYPLLWGLTAFVLNYIPSIGSILAAIPPMILTWIDVGLGRALLVALVYVVVNLVLGNLVEPHLMGRRFGISTLVVILSLLFWGWLWGPVGMLLSVPLTMIVKIMMENTEDFRWLAQLMAAPRSRLLVEPGDEVEDDTIWR